MTRGFKQLIDKLYAQKEYRPEAVAIIYNSQRQFLITKTPIKNSQTPWSFPQEGIEMGENLEEALTRGLKEELGITPNELKYIQRGFMREEVNAESTREDKRGFTKGKAYIFSLLEYIGDGTLKLDPNEVEKAEWISNTKAEEYFNKARPEKAGLLINVLKQATHIISN